MMAMACVCLRLTMYVLHTCGKWKTCSSDSDGALNNEFIFVSWMRCIFSLHIVLSRKSGRQKKGRDNKIKLLGRQRTRPKSLHCQNRRKLLQQHHQKKRSKNEKKCCRYTYSSADVNSLCFHFFVCLFCHLSPRQVVRLTIVGENVYSFIQLYWDWVYRIRASAKTEPNKSNIKARVWSYYLSGQTTCTQRDFVLNFTCWWEYIIVYLPDQRTIDMYICMRCQADYTWRDQIVNPNGKQTSCKWYEIKSQFWHFQFGRLEGGRIEQKKLHEDVQHEKTVWCVFRKH